MFVSTSSRPETQLQSLKLTYLIHKLLQQTSISKLITSPTTQTCLILLFTYFVLVLFCASIFLPTTIIMLNSNIQAAIAKFCEISEKDFFRVFILVRNFLHVLTIGILAPLILMTLSNELRPFLLESLSCACFNNNVMIEVYN